jgi:folate-binding protein YgfZ
MPSNIAKLANRAVIGLTGEETLPFLQDLLTCEVETLKPGEAAHGGLLTPQGKILFDFFVIATPDGALLDCDAGQRDGLLQRLTMYKLRRAITLAAQDGLGVAAAWGDGDLPPIEGALVYADPRLTDLGHRIIAPASVLGGIANASADDYTAMRIALGVADSAEIGSGEMFPHEANYDQFGSVNFRKGCYVGQEVVSRMQHRGTARARIVPVKGEGLTTGSEIRAGERVIGTILSVAGDTALARVRLDRASQAEAAGEAASADGHRVTIRRPDWAGYPAPGGEN